MSSIVVEYVLCVQCLSFTVGLVYLFPVVVYKYRSMPTDRSPDAVFELLCPNMGNEGAVLEPSDVAESVLACRERRYRSYGVRRYE